MKGGKHGESPEISHLREWRKRIGQVKVTPDLEPANQEILLEGIQIVLHPYSSASAIELLALLTVLLRQLKVALDAATDGRNGSLLQEGIWQYLAPSFQPQGGHLALHLYHSLASESKTVQKHAIEVLGSVGKLAQALPPPSEGSTSNSQPNFLLGLVHHAASQTIISRSELLILSTLIDHVPVTALLDTLLKRLFQDIASTESAAIRCNLIVAILQGWWDHSLRSAASVSNGKYSASNARTHDKDQDQYKRVVLLPLLPYFHRASGARTNVLRYIFPALCATASFEPHLLLSLLDDPQASTGFSVGEMFPAWVAVASAAVSTRSMSLGDLPPHRVQEAMWHSDAAVRLMAFKLVTCSEDVLAPEMVESIKEVFLCNANLPGAGQRADMASATHTFFTYLQVEGHAAFRVKERLSKGLKPFKEHANPDTEPNFAIPSFRRTMWEDVDTALKSLEEIHRCLIQDFILPAIKESRRHPIMRALGGLNTLRVYIEIFGGEREGEVYRKEMVEALLACQASEFTEVRSRARAILMSSTTPLAGYETFFTPSSQALYASALSSLNHPRKVQAEAGRAALCILFEKVVLGTEHELAFVGSVITQLEEHMFAAEKDLVGSIDKKPLHGSLAALRDLMACLDLQNPERQATWRLTLRRLFVLVERVWTITRPVISLAPTQPAQKEGNNTSSTSTSSARPEHEIARAYDVLGAGDDEGEDDEMDHTGLLSGCWRATKEAGELLSSIVEFPLTQGGSLQSIWTREDIARAGQVFLVWLHEIRHRGTFSKISTAFGRFVEAVRSVADLGDLCTLWLESELETISRDQLSTTRRSAALPYSLLALVSNHPASLEIAINRLLDLARVDSGSDDIAKVHAFNVLKIVLLDARQTKWLDRYFERAVMTALAGLRSANWNVRNVGLMLFSTLVHRSLTSARGSQHFHASRPSLSKRQTYAAWHAKYPSLLPYLTSHLEEYHKAQTKNPNANANAHSPLFPILIIIRSLRWSQDSIELQSKLVKAVEPFLGSREWQVREVAAQALSSLFSPSEAVSRLTSESKQSPRALNANVAHGHYLFLRHLITDVVDFFHLTETEREEMELGLHLALERYGAGDNPLISKTIIECLEAYITASPQVPTIMLEHAVQIAKAPFRSGKVGQPGWDLYLASCSQFLLSPKVISEDNLIFLISGAFQRGEQIPALQALLSFSSDSGPSYKPNSIILDRVISLARTEKQDVYVRIQALDTLGQVEWSSDILRSTGIAAQIRSLYDSLVGVMDTSRCVPLREAALAASGWVLQVLRRDGHADVGLNNLSARLLEASHEIQSQPTRMAAMQCLAHLSDSLFPAIASSTESATPPKTLLALHKALLRLMQDDDEKVREGACEIVTATGPGSLSNEKALGRWWDWLGSYLAGSGTSGDGIQPWAEWLVELALDLQGLQGDLACMSRLRPEESEGVGVGVGSNVLFEIEPPNLFRDPLIDSARTIHLLQRLNSMRLLTLNNEIRGWYDRAKDGHERGVRDDSPVDDTWEARRVMRFRLDLLSDLFVD